METENKGEAMQTQSNNGGEYEENQPIRNGVVCHWDQMEALWHYILYEQLGWELGNEGSVLITERYLTSSKLQREMMTQLMFEKFNASGLYMADQARLALASYGKVSGCVVDIGHGNIGISCVTDGQLHQPSCEAMPFGGEHLTALFQKWTGLSNGGKALSGNQAAALKHEYMEVCSSSETYSARAAAADTDADSSTHGREHKLPDGTTITIGKEAIDAGEILFRPRHFGYNCMGLAEMIYTSIFSISDLPMKKTLTENLLVTGCGVATKGLEQRLLHSVRMSLAPSFMASVLRRPEYMPPACPMYSSWMGGFIEAKLAFSQNQHITKYDYDECGPSIIHKKAFL
jgi:actin-related protein 7